jgi:phosphate starvation-inducible PhoH-like protein
MFLTRMGVSSKFIMTGDTTQIDLPRKNESGLLQAIRILGNIEGISVIRFDERDIVRHKLVKHIVRAYETEENDSSRDKGSLSRNEQPGKPNNGNDEITK